MRIRMFTAATAAAALAMSPIAAQASSPLLMSAQSTAQVGDEDDQINGGGTEIAIIFVLIVFVIALFAVSDGENAPPPPVSP